MTLGKTFRRHIPLLSECMATIAHRTYAEDGLITRHTADFVRDPQFVAAYSKGKATGSWGNMEPRWRVYTACSWAKRAAKLPGDFVECGVNRGGMPLAIMEYLSFNYLNKRFYLLDTFCGFPQRYSYSNGHAYSDSFEFVIQTFKPYPGVWNSSGPNSFRVRLSSWMITQAGKITACKKPRWTRWREHSELKLRRFLPDRA